MPRPAHREAHRVDTLARVLDHYHLPVGLRLTQEGMNQFLDGGIDTAKDRNLNQYFLPGGKKSSRRYSPSENTQKENQEQRNDRAQSGDRKGQIRIRMQLPGQDIEHAIQQLDHPPQKPESDGDREKYQQHRQKVALQTFSQSHLSSNGRLFHLASHPPYRRRIALSMSRVFPIRTAKASNAVSRISSTGSSVAESQRVTYSTLASGSFSISAQTASVITRPLISPLFTSHAARPRDRDRHKAVCRSSGLR